MLFDRESDFLFISQCKNYRVTVANANGIKFFYPQRFTSNGTWHPIGENGKPYYTWDETLFRIRELHNTQRSMEVFKNPGNIQLASRASYDKARSLMRKILA